MLRLPFLKSFQSMMFSCCCCLLISSVFILSQANLIERDNKVDLFRQGDVGQPIKGQKNLSNGANEITDESTSVLLEKLKQKLARKNSVRNQVEITDNQVEEGPISIEPNEAESQLQVYPLPTKQHPKQASTIHSNILHSKDNGGAFGYHEDDKQQEEEVEEKEKQLLKQTKISSLPRRQQILLREEGK